MGKMLIVWTWIIITVSSQLSEHHVLMVSGHVIPCHLRGKLPVSTVTVSMDSRSSRWWTSQFCCLLVGGVYPPRPLGVLLHVVQVGRHDEVFGVVQASLVGVLLPAGVVALVGDVALSSPRLKLPEVQPGLVVLKDEENKKKKAAVTLKPKNAENTFSQSSLSCNPSWTVFG